MHSKKIVLVVRRAESVYTDRLTQINNVEYVTVVSQGYISMSWGKE